MEYEEEFPLYVAREISILIRIQHPTIIKFRGYSKVDFNGNNQTTFLMDYLKRGSLSDLLKNELHSLCDADYNNTKRQIILIGVARGMMILHKYNVIHRDLKAENILLEEDYSPQISDFGLAKFMDPENSMKQSISCLGTIPYMAPEVSNSTQYDVKADVYSFGILMYEILTGTRAYSEEIKKEKLTELTLALKINDGYRPKFKYPIKKGLRRMIELCWSENPKERPTFCEIFLKLSLLDEDDFVPFKLSYNESQLNKIEIDDDDDDDDEPKNMKFCLPDVDTKEVFSYVERISQETMLLSSKLGITKDISKGKDDEIMNLKKENEELKKQIMNLKKQNDVGDKMKQMPETKPVVLINREKTNESKSPVIKKASSDLNPIILKPQTKKSNQSPIINKAPQVNTKVETRPSSDLNKIKPTKKVYDKKISYHEFEYKRISEQIEIISEILLNPNAHPFYSKLLKFLNFFKYSRNHCRFKDFDDKKDITSITEEPQIKFNTEFTDYILDRNKLNSTEFIQILKEFEKSILFSIKFPSTYIESELSAISSPKYIHQLEIEVEIQCETYKNLQPILKQYPTIKYVWLYCDISKIEPSAFTECKSITSIKGSDVVYISDNAFKGCTSLQNFSFSSNLDYIGDNAFHSCSSLREITFENESENDYSKSIIQFIGSSAFFGCTSLKRVTIKDINNIKSKVFEECKSLEEVKITSIKHLKTPIFKGCVSLKIIKINKIDDLNLSVFNDCPFLEILEINTVNKIELLSFKPIKSLKQFTINDCSNFEIIKNGMFEGCKSLVEIKMPSSVIKQIGAAAFKGCSSLKRLDFKVDINVINESTFENCSSIEYCSMSKMCVLKSKCFSGCTSLYNVEISPTIKNIPSYAFEKCSSIKFLQLPPSVVKIEPYAFSFCTSLVQILLPSSSLKSIGSNAFSFCTSLIQITIPNSVTSIGSNAFFSCISMKEISLPSTINTKDIGLEPKVIITTF